MGGKEQSVYKIIGITNFPLIFNETQEGNVNISKQLKLLAFFKENNTATHVDSTCISLVLK